MKANRLTITVVVSVGLHLAVAAYYIGWHSQEALQISSETIGQPLNIRIAQDKRLKSDETRPKVKPTPEKTQPKAVEPQVSKQNLDNEPARQASESQEKQVSKEQRNSTTNSDYALQNNNMVKYLSSEFRLRFKYPIQARKRGWQGTVVVGLNVSQKGRITQVAIQQSSGFGVLDRNAVNTFRAIEQLTPELSSSLLRNHQLSIPVIYNLTGG